MNRLINCIAIDDEPFALKIIEGFCAKIPCIRLNKLFNNAIEALQYLKYHKPDIIFLDIKMPDISGIQLAKNLDKFPFVVFITAHSKYAAQSYDLDAVDYLLKPFDFERFFKAIKKARQHLKMQDETSGEEKQLPTISVRVEYKNVKIKIEDIVYLEATGNYVKIFTTTQMYMPQINLKKILEILPDEKFVRVHKSFAVALTEIDFYTTKEISVKQGKIPIGRNYLNTFIRIIDKENNTINT